MSEVAPMGLRALFRSCFAVLSGAAAGFPGVFESLHFDDLYEGNEAFPVRLSKRARALAGSRVAMTGYLARIDPAVPAAYLLTRHPGQQNALTEAANGWSTDRVLVHLRERPTVLPVVLPSTVVGRLEVGLAEDPDFGWRSHVRLVDARIAMPD